MMGALVTLGEEEKEVRLHGQGWTGGSLTDNGDAVHVQPPMVNKPEQVHVDNHLADSAETTKEDG